MPATGSCRAPAASIQKSPISHPFLGMHEPLATSRLASSCLTEFGDDVYAIMMIAGFALLAWPADYDSSGIMTLLVSHQGKVYEKDLGEKTPELVKGISEYDPDITWALADADASASLK